MTDNWFALYTKSNFEKKVVTSLLNKNIEAFCPTFKTYKQYSDRRKKVEKVLLPNYVFTRVNSLNREKVFTVNGVLRYVYWLGKPAKIRPIEITEMRNHLNQFYDDFTMEKIELNSNYKIKSGPFKGITGEVVSLDKSNIKLALNTLGVLITLKKNKA